MAMKGEGATSSHLRGRRRPLPHFVAGKMKIYSKAKDFDDVRIARGLINLHKIRLK
jgi:hypothetical protein